VKSTCVFPVRQPFIRVSSGIDFASTDELIAANKSLDEVRRYTGADSIGYLSVEGLLSPFPNAPDYCTACFSGQYPWTSAGCMARTH